MAGQSVAIVTGAAHGLGRVIAHALFEQGHAVALADIDLPAAQTVAAAIVDQGGKATAFHLDVALAADVDRTFREISTTLGAPTVLINNAGIYPDDAILEMTEASWDRVLSVNL